VALEARGFRARVFGLAFLRELPPGYALLIPRCRSVHTFGMRFVLQLRWLGDDGRTIRVDGHVPPMRLRSCRSAIAVLEAHTVYGMAVDPATLLRETRERHGLSQARLAHRARTTQGAISRIERGEEAVTWERLRGLLHAMGEEPTLGSSQVDYDGDSFDLLRARQVPIEVLLESALASNKNIAEFRMQMAEGQREAGRPVTVFDPSRFEAAPILGTLREFRVDFVLIGGVAVQAYGSPKLTNDLDVVAAPDLTNMARLAEALAELEAEWRDPRVRFSLADPQKLRRASQLSLTTKFGKVDVMKSEYVAGLPYEALRANAVQAGPFLVAGVDDMIRMKRSAGRWQDLRDIATLTRPDADLQREADAWVEGINRELEGDD
jgi:transcriptional regulator with XRE-family HTH domain